MSRIVAFTFMIVVGLLTLGCKKDGPSASLVPDQSDVLNIESPSPTPAPMPAPQPLAAQPVYESQPVAKPYTIRKGDTLFSIAKSQYGTGRDWQKIVQANPGLDPRKLKVGQQIAIP